MNKRKTKLEQTMSALGSIGRELTEMAAHGEFQPHDFGRLEEFANVLRGASHMHRVRCLSPAALVFEKGHPYHGLLCDRDADHPLAEQHVDQSGLRSWNDLSTIEASR
jgi:hypothetical protein